MTTTASRWLIFFLLAFSVSVPRAQAQNDAPTAINGVYTGTYQCSDGEVKAKLSLKSTGDGSLSGLFTFELPARFASRSVTYKLTGRYVAGNRFPFQFMTAEPLGAPAPDAYAMQSVVISFRQGQLVLGRNGYEYGINPDQIYGAVGGHASVGLDATRDKAESANLDRVMAAQLLAANGTGTTTPAAGAAPLSAIDGVYHGSYADDQGPMKFKLTITQEDNKVTGVFTFFLPEGSATNACTFEFTGWYYSDRRRFQFFGGIWETPPNWNTLSASTKRLLKFGPRNQFGPGHEYTAGMDGVFDPGGGNGAGQISGRMDDPSNSQFQAIRDAAESVNMANARLRNNIRPSIEGVFNGTYTREKGTPTKFKLTITHTHDGGAIDRLAGMATIYLPNDSGTKAYSYGLKGAIVPGSPNEFELQVSDWVTIPPKDFENFKAMGFNGTFVLNLAQNTARITSVQQHDADSIPTFEATWSPTESSDIEGTLAAQKKVDAADYAAALKKRDEAVRNAPPKQLASKDLVRKSRAYWDSYQTDMIREVFDGGFGAAIDEDQQFQFLFCTYVEMYSAQYAALLPPNHQTVTITRSSRKPDGNGGYIDVPASSSTVEVDSRLAPKYRQFAEGLGSSANGMGAAIAAMASGASPRDLINNLLAPKRDMERFFANHEGKSAAMRQLTENFLRGITGEPSLQQADGKIEGAQAETDKDLPPGRYARFVDAANASFRERAKADPDRFGNSSSHDTAFCQHLAEQEQSVMSRQEEYYYANDFEGRFGPIMASRENSTDPAWPRLHAAYVKAVE